MATKFITVPVEILRNKDLNHSQKFILSEIMQLQELKKGCVAQNQHFADLIGITKENISRNISELKDKGYISIDIVNGSRNHERIIKIITLTKTARPPYQNSKTPLLKQQETKENKTINKTINKTVIDFFDKVWLLYPKKTEKKKVSLSVKKEVYKISMEEWKRVIIRYSSTWDHIKWCKGGYRFFDHEVYIPYLDENWEEPEQEKKKEYEQEPRTPEEREYFYQLKVKDQHGDLWNEDMEGRLLRAKEKAEQSLNPKLQEQF